MSLLSSVIVTVCMGAQGSYKSACNATLDAGTQATGFNQDFRNFEKDTTRWADRFATTHLGEDGKNVTGGMIFLIKAASSKAVVIPIPTAGFADKITSRVGADQAMIMISWTF